MQLMEKVKAEKQIVDAKKKEKDGAQKEVEKWVVCLPISH